jgi:Flp pilus assembly protein TadG
MRGCRDSSKEPAKTEPRTGFLSRLRADEAGNTLAIAAAALLPLIGLVGGGVDMSRMYIVKTRLQHACDAGALAGRKAMGAGVWNFDSYAARDAAEGFFDANIQADPYGATGLTRSFTEDAGKVMGTASATVPMTLMQVFGKESQTLTVTCDAEMRLPNTDVMFVLDVTGSMGERPSGDSQTKIQSLRVAVKCFYEIVARLDTDANCTTGAPSGGTGDQVQIRFGFVPYATNVNVGRVLPTNYMANSWNYQTRRRVGTGWGSWSTYGYTNSSYYGSCSNPPANNAETQYQVDKINYRGDYYCRYQSRGLVPAWEYDQLPVDVGLLKDGTAWRNSFVWPIANDGSDKTIDWDGCIEERQTVRTTDFTPIPAGAKDLDIDLVPTGDTSTQWGPALPDLIYTRKSGSGNWDRARVNSTTDNYTNTSSYFCPTPARKLQAWTDASGFDSYVNSLTPSGNTYHDIGLLWGARLLSPTGLFRAENEYASEGGEIERHLIFMTDGDTVTSSENYTAYGIPWFDRRHTTDTSRAGQDEQVDLRFAALCSAVKNKNITLWVISFGSVASDTVTRLRNCATSGRYFHATNAATIQQTFRSIADEISQLRLTR